LERLHLRQAGYCASGRRRRRFSGRRNGRRDGRENWRENRRENRRCRNLRGRFRFFVHETGRVPDTLTTLTLMGRVRSGLGFFHRCLRCFVARLAIAAFTPVTAVAVARAAFAAFIAFLSIRWPRVLVRM